MGIEPTSEPWEVLTIPIPFSSERHAATSTRNLAVGRTVHAGPPAPSERPPSGFQSPAILRLEPSVVSAVAVQYSETSALARGKSANSRPPPPCASPAYSASPVIRLIGISLRGLTISSEQSTIQKYRVLARIESQNATTSTSGASHDY
jgi:hypothetical protein